MTGCSCPHAVNEHGDVAQFGQRICLVAGCDCSGTHEEIVMGAVQRTIGKQRVLHDLTDTVRFALEGSPYIGLRNDDFAMVIAVEILEKFNVEKKR